MLVFCQDGWVGVYSDNSGVVILVASTGTLMLSWALQRCNSHLRIHLV